MPRRTTGDRGTGLIGTLSGTLAFLLLMFVAVHLLLGLHARSLLTSAAHEGARLAAGRGVDQGNRTSVAHARSLGERRVRQLLGRLGDRVQLDWSASDHDTVVLRARAVVPRQGLDDLLIDRTVRVRVERLR